MIPPSEDEKHYYYNGLPSRPVLVARTTTDQWVMYEDFHGVYKSLDVVREHAIKELWNDESGPLRKQVIECLEGIEWVAIDILRLGLEQDKPVTMFISVKKDSTDFNTGLDTVRRCQQILRTHQLGDVEVEMKEATLIALNSESTAGEQSNSSSHDQTPRFIPMPPDDTYYDLIIPFTECIGTPLSPTGYIGRGTKGMYLRDESKTYALTCRHVVLPQGKNSRKFSDFGDYRHSNENAVTVVQPGARDYDDVVSDHELRFGALKDTIESMELLQRLPDREVDAGLLQRYRQQLSNLMDYDTLHLQMKQPGRRIPGHVQFSPRTEVYIPAQGHQHIRDWALVELDPSKFTTPLESLRNTLPMTHELMEILSKFGPTWFNPNRHTIDIGPDTIPYEDLEHTDFVIKYGAVTHYTLGKTNAVKSVLRHATPDGQCHHSTEWCIVGIGKAFSKPGDSGSCVFNRRGQIGGMLTGGLGDDERCDITYVTPIHWLLEDIRQSFGELRLV
ncbi:hypothetical protein LB507_000244 [Fusarium sp. FIESC RH6]|nr:hypothetical protein LB507_000244 [Fusarium sp. FIESC RH6]